jgi:hypothetical protein
MAARGIYRIRRHWPRQDSAVIVDEDRRLELPQDRYMANAYRPLFDDLPWREDYVEPEYDPASERPAGFKT